MERPEDPDRVGSDRLDSGRLESDPVEETEDAAAERLEHKRPAAPQGPDAGFAEGGKLDPDAPEEELEPDFARGVRTGPEAEVEEQGRFSEGIEQEPKHSPDKDVERRFSEGIEQSPTSE
jgi:hypothetical protein